MTSPSEQKAKTNRPNLLAQIPIVLALDTAKMNGAPEGMVMFRKGAVSYGTLDVHGIIGISSITRKQIIEDMDCYLGDEEVYNSLPEKLLQQITDDILWGEYD